MRFAVIPETMTVNFKITWPEKPIKIVIEHIEGEVITPEQKEKILALSEKLAANDEAVGEALKP